MLYKSYFYLAQKEKPYLSASSHSKGRTLRLRSRSCSRQDLLGEGTGEVSGWESSKTPSGYRLTERTRAPMMCITMQGQHVNM